MRDALLTAALCLVIAAAALSCAFVVAVERPHALAFFDLPPQVVLAGMLMVIFGSLAWVNS